MAEVSEVLAHKPFYLFIFWYFADATSKTISDNPKSFELQNYFFAFHNLNLAFLFFINDFSKDGSTIQFLFTENVQGQALIFSLALENESIYKEQKKT